MSTASQVSTGSPSSLDELEGLLRTTVHIANEVITFEAHRAAVVCLTEPLGRYRWHLLEGFAPLEVGGDGADWTDAFRAWAARGVVAEASRGAATRGDEPSPASQETQGQIRTADCLSLRWLAGPDLAAELVLGVEAEDAFTAHDVQVAVALVRVVAHACQSSAHLAELRRLLVAMLDQRPHMLNASDIRQVMRHKAQAAGWLLTARADESDTSEIAASYYMREAGGGYQLWAVAGKADPPDRAAVRPVQRIRLTESSAQTRALRARMVYRASVDDQVADGVDAQRPDGDCIVAPVLSGAGRDEVGMFEVRRAHGTFDGLDEATMVLFAAHLADPLRAARTIEELSHRNRQFGFLLRLRPIEPLVTDLQRYPFWKTLDTWLRSVYQLNNCAASRVMFSVYDSFSEQVIGLHAFGDDETQCLRLLHQTRRSAVGGSNDCQGRAVATGQVQRIDRPRGHPNADQATVESCDVGPFVVVPVCAEDGNRRTQLGTLHYELRERRPVQKDELRQLMLLAAQGAEQLLGEFREATRRVAVEDSPEPTYLVDDDRNLHGANDSLCALLDCRPDCTGSSTCYRELFGRDAPCDDCVLNGRRSPDGSSRVERREATLRSGALRVLRQSAKPLAERGGKRPWQAVTAADVSHSDRLLAASERLLATRTTADVFGAVADALRGLGFNQFRRYELFDEGRRLRLAAQAPNEHPMPEGLELVRDEHAEAFVAIDSNAPLVCHYAPDHAAKPPVPCAVSGRLELHCQDHKRAELGKDSVRVWFDLPLVVSGDPLGKLSVDYLGQPDDVRMSRDHQTLTLLARYAALAFDRLRQVDAVMATLKGLGHDIGNMLGAVGNDADVLATIGGAASLVSALPFGRECQARAQACGSKVLSASAMVAEWRHRAGHASDRPARQADTDLRRFACELLDAFAEPLSDLAAAWVLDVANDLPAVAAVDQIDLWRVVWNLLCNAANAIDGCDVRDVTLRLRRDGAELVVDVVDTGPGIPASKREEVFREGNRLGRAGGQVVGEGTGFGLSICRKLAARSGGRVEVVSPEGAGAVLSVRLPIGTWSEEVPPTLNEAHIRCLRSHRLLLLSNSPAVGAALSAAARPLGIVIEQQPLRCFDDCAEVGFTSDTVVVADLQSLPATVAAKWFDHFHTTGTAFQIRTVAIMRERTLAAKRLERRGDVAVVAPPVWPQRVLRAMAEKIDPICSNGAVGGEADPYSDYAAREPRRILAVDDQRLVLAGLHDKLETMGYSLESTVDATEVLPALRAAIAEGYPFDLAILDIQMPGQDGRELARAIHSELGHQAPRLVAWSDDGEWLTLAGGRSSLFAHHLSKNVSRSALTRVIDDTPRLSVRAAMPTAGTNALDAPDRDGVLSTLADLRVAAVGGLWLMETLQELGNLGGNNLDALAAADSKAAGSELHKLRNLARAAKLDATWRQILVASRTWDDLTASERERLLRRVSRNAMLAIELCVAARKDGHRASPPASRD